MKAKYIVIGMLALTLGTACSEDEKLIEEGLDLNQMEIEATGGTQNVRVNIPGRWTASCSESWIQVSPTNGKGEEICTIKVDTTLLANEARKTTIYFIADEDADSYSIDVAQKGFEKALTLSETAVSLENYAEFGKRYFDIEVTSNVKFDIEIPEEAQTWLKYDKYNFSLDKGYCPRTTKIRFQWEGNNDPQVRDTKVTFRTEEEDLAKHDALIISQDRAPEITPDRAGDSLALVICERKLRPQEEWDKGERLENWTGVKLWEETDKGYTDEKKGRVRLAQFKFVRTKEGIPDEIKHLKYLESLSIYSNGNWRNYSFDTGTAITELTNLKYLQLFAIGLTTLPEEFKKLNKLEVLDLSGNNFQSLPTVLTPENFPELKHLNLVNNRRSLEEDIQLETMDKERWGGFYDDNKSARNNVLKTLFRWEKLESLLLSNNIIKGEIPPMNEFDVPKYTQADIDAKGDTLKTIAPKLIGTPKVLPNCKDLRIGLNYLHGKVPDWLLYHPYLVFWAPDISIFKQQEYPDDDGTPSGFSNVPDSYNYYYEAYPVYKNSGELNE